MRRKPEPNDMVDWTIALIYALLFVTAFSFAAHGQTVDEVRSVIVEEAEKQNFDADLALAIAEVESGFNPAAVGGLGEVGVFQLRPEFHPVVPGDVRKNAETAVRYLVQLRESCARYGEAYFVCFNTGPNRQLKSPEAFPYYRKVMGVRRRLVAR